MAMKLGIALDAGRTEDAEAEYWLLWIAVEALRAPLPPLWRQLPTGQYEHSVTKERTSSHPMLPIFIEMASRERSRKKDNRPFAALERFMLFTTEGDDESAFIFYNFATRQSLGGRKLPAEAVAAQKSLRRPPPPPKKHTDRATAASLGGRVEKYESDVGKLTLAEQRAEAKKKEAKEAREKEAAKPLSKEAVAKLRAQAVVVRKKALALRPRPLPELLVAARTLQVDLVTNPSLVWLVDLVLACDFMPAGWEPVPREQMSEMASSHNRGEIMMRGLLSNKAGEAERATKHAQEVDWLPPMERLWIVATSNEAPTQYSSQLCSLITERHPCDGFVRAVTASVVK